MGYLISAGTFDARCHLYMAADGNIIAGSRK